MSNSEESEQGVFVLRLIFFISDLEFEHKDPDPGSFVTSEDEGLRLKWTAFLEFTQNQDVGDMTWDKVCKTLFLQFCLLQSDCFSFTVNDNKGKTTLKHYTCLPWSLRFVNIQGLGSNRNDK